MTHVRSLYQYNGISTITHFICLSGFSSLFHFLHLHSVFLLQELFHKRIKTTFFFCLVSFLWGQKKCKGKLYANCTCMQRILAVQHFCLDTSPKIWLHFHKLALSLKSKMLIIHFIPSSPDMQSSVNRLTSVQRHIFFKSQFCFS